MKRFSFLFILSVFSAAPAFADDVPSAKETAKIESCVAKSADEKCIGLISDACMEALEMQSTASMGECITKETKIWDAMLNRDYKAALLHAEGKSVSALKAAQRQWVKFRDAKCAFVASHDGTMYVNFTQSCYQIETARQAMWLHNWKSE